MEVVNQFTGAGFPVVAGDLNRDFAVKVQIKENERNNIQAETETVTLTETETEEEEFSFDCLNPDGSPISADDVFQDGKIRTVHPFLNDDLVFANENGVVLDSEVRSPLKKVFVEDSSATTSYGGGRIVVEKTSPDTCKKSNSTGFSKVWRFKDLLTRSNSEGADAFVFLNNTTSSSVKNEKKQKATKEKRGKTASVSAHEKHYVKNRAMREGEKRRSYLPYKQFGFFTNVNSLSRNLHPF